MKKVSLRKKSVIKQALDNKVAKKQIQLTKKKPLPKVVENVVVKPKTKKKVYTKEVKSTKNDTKSKGKSNKLVKEKKVNYIQTDNYIDIYENYDITNNQSRPVLTKYEYTFMLGKRATQLASGAEPLVDIPEGVDDIYQIAQMEIHQRKIPFMVKRSIGDHFEYWRIEDLQIPNISI